MIEYSIYMMGNPIKPEEPQKAYAKNQVREIWDLNKFCKHIASHNAGYSRGMVKAILSDMCDCIVEQLLNGNTIKLGEFNLVAVEQLLYNAVTHVRQDGFHHTSAVASVM